LGVFGGLAQSGFGSRQVQFHQFFNAFKGFAGQTKKRFEVGFVCGHQLFCSHHENLQNLKSFQPMRCNRLKPMHLVAVQHFEFYAGESEKQDFFVALQQFRVDFLKLRTITYARFLCRSFRFAPA
jgi:hypothetical protein